MWIDILVVIMLVTAVINGWRNGLIHALFSLVGLVVGLAAALKLSAVVANYLRVKSQWDSQYWPFIAFALVFLVVVLIVRLISGIITKSMDFALIGWVNRLGGFIFYAIINLLVLSIFLFFINQFGLISEEVKTKSVSYAVLEPMGPGLIKGIGHLIPVFGDVFDDLQHFFEEAGKKMGGH